MQPGRVLVADFPQDDRRADFGFRERGQLGFLDFAGGRDYNGFRRNETALAFNGLVFVNPKNKTQLYFLAGFGWACFGITIAGFASSIENFSYVVSAVLTPLFLVAGTFFPLTKLPRWAQIAGELNPLHHCVELVRHAAFGWHLWDIGRVGALLAFGLVIWRLAIYAMTRKLID